jgi:hypothetical protein
MVADRGWSATVDIESDHVQPAHYKSELEAWLNRIQSTDPYHRDDLPLANGIDGLSVIDLLHRMTVKNGVRQSAIERSPLGI